MRTGYLIQMSDFLLQFKDPQCKAKDAADHLAVNFSYASFLKTGLDIFMFVPCLGGEHFEMPVRGVYVEEKDFFEDMAIYSKLQEEVLFEGFIWKDGGAVLVGDNKSDGHIFIDEEYCSERTVECLLNEFKYRFKLTPAALKLIYPEQYKVPF